MFVEKYVTDFSESAYKYYLADKNKLIQLANAYIDQYSNPTYDCTIAFKESLDHYIVKQYLSNPSFIETIEFNNYVQYLNYIFSKRIGIRNYQLEFNTNIVFQNEKLKNYILSLYDNNTKETLLSVIKKNVDFINSIYEKMSNGQALTQFEIDMLSDYLYTKRDLDNPCYLMFIDYILNSSGNLKASPQIMAAYIAYLPKVFGEGCENSRIILSNGISKASDIAVILPSEIDQYRGKKKLRYSGLYSSSNKYISIDWNLLKNLSFQSDKSLNISRTFKEDNRDIYWISMVCFHELAHQFQNNSMNSSEINSSGLSQLIKRAKRNDTDNTLNHDSIESEIEADEMAWSKMHYFILKFRSKSKNSALNKDDIDNQLKKCLVNRESVYARRAIQTKYNSDERFLAAAIKEIKSLINDPNLGDKYKIYFRKLLINYPMLGKIFDENGNVKTRIMFDVGLTSKNEMGNDENIISCELANYILNEGYNVLKRHLVNDNLTKDQITNLMMNIYNTYHLEKKFINSLAKLDFSQLEETNTNFDYKDQETLINKYLEKFKNVANLIYKERELVTIINRKYPEYKIEEVCDPKYAYWNYQDMFNHLFRVCNGNIEYDKVRDIIEKYESSGDPALIKLATETRKRLDMPSDDLDRKSK